jgi:hypothetical protein
LVEPPVATPAVIALRKESLVRIAPGVSLRSTSRMTSRPASRQTASLRGAAAGGSIEPNGDSPRNSIDIAMVLAV